jgi:HTH-type transcriptional regulator/antitoxin MqsA
MKNCPVCGSDLLIEVVRPEKFLYEGHSVTIDDYRSFECGRCGNSFADPKSVEHAEPILRDLHRRAERLLTSMEIKAIRSSLGYSQDDFGTLLGGGKKAFARYENGKVTQARSMDNLLRAIRFRPDVISAFESEREGSPSKICRFVVSSRLDIWQEVPSESYTLKQPILVASRQGSLAA